MYDVEHMDHAIAEIHQLRAQVQKLKDQDRMKNKRCALDVAGRVLNANIQAMKPGTEVGKKARSEEYEEVARAVTVVADKLVEWLNKEEDE